MNVETLKQAVRVLPSDTVIGVVGHERYEQAYRSLWMAEEPSSGSKWSYRPQRTSAEIARRLVAIPVDRWVGTSEVAELMRVANSTALAQTKRFIAKGFVERRVTNNMRQANNAFEYRRTAAGTRKLKEEMVL